MSDDKEASATMQTLHYTNSMMNSSYDEVDNKIMHIYERKQILLMENEIVIMLHNLVIIAEVFL